MRRGDFLAMVRGALVKPIKRPIWQAVFAATGRRLQLPTRFFDFGMYGGIFEARAAAVRDRLPPSFDVIEHRAGWSELRLVGLDYRRADLLSPYRELAVLAPVRYALEDQTLAAGQLVLHMPVTSEEARWGGVENYGFPKFVADIRIAPENGGHACEVHHAGVHVLTLRVEGRPTTRGKFVDHNFTVRGDGVVVSSTFDVDGELSEAERPGGVVLELGRHAIADQLRQLDLQVAGGRALYVPRAHGILSAGKEVGRLARMPASPPVSAAKHASTR